MRKAKARYDLLQSRRTNFLDVAQKCAELTLPHLIDDDLTKKSSRKALVCPWQSVGAKAVTNLASKLMLALLPPQTSFFKLQIRDDKLGTELDPTVRSELDLSFSKMERMVMDSINASSDRVVIHEAIKHLIVGGNALLFMGKDGMKHFPLNRYVINRDGNGNLLEIVTKELINREELGLPLPKPNAPGDDGYKDDGVDEDVAVYTYVRLENGRWVWHQEAFDKILPGSRSTAPKNASPWLVLRFNKGVDGEDYGRGRVEEYLGDLRSLDNLSRSLVEGTSAAAKLIFLVSPSSTTKPQTLATAGNGAIVQGRPDDVGVVQATGKATDFRTAADVANGIERRIAEAFLQLNVRQSERTTAEEVRLTQLELEQSLGNIFSLMTVEFLVPYLNRKLMVLQRSGEMPKLPKDLVRPQIVAGVNAPGRGQDRESLTQFIQLIAQTLGPEAMMKFIDPTEAIKRLAASSGIDVLNLVKTAEQLQQDKQIAQGDAMQQSLVDQAGQLAGTPMMDPSKNPQINGNEFTQETPQPEPPTGPEGAAEGI
nr:hypothetical protein 19 [bacterium]